VAVNQEVVANRQMQPEVENPKWRPLNFKYSDFKQDSNTIPTAILFSGSNDPITIVVILYNQTGRNREWKSKMETKTSSEMFDIDSYNKTGNIITIEQNR